MRSVQDWNISDLDALCQNKVEEGPGLEFKQSLALDKSKKGEICKDVSAMANAAGGIIIYGIIENELGEATSIDGGCDPLITTPEWIDQVITSGIEPRILTTTIQPIKLYNGNRAFAINIPQAMSLAPHQSREQRRYFRRCGRRIEAMFDHEVRDLMRRASTPELFIRFDIARSGNDWLLSGFIGNRSSEPALYSMMTFIFDRALNVDIPNSERLPTEIAINANGTSHPAKVSIVKMGVPGQFPIFKEVEWNLFNVKISVEDNTSYPFEYSVRCPGFETTRSGSIYFQNGIAVIEESLE